MKILKNIAGQDRSLNPAQPKLGNIIMEIHYLSLLCHWGINNFLFYF